MKSFRKYRFGIVASCFNPTYVDAMLASTQKGLKGHKQKVIRVPGAYEIPLQVQRLARTKKYDAIIALGLVWHGKTAHGTEILRAVTDALMHINLKYNVPIIHQVLSVATEAEAVARTMGSKLNRGQEAAKAALMLANLEKI